MEIEQSKDKKIDLKSVEKFLTQSHPDFVYREHQKETILTLVDKFINEDEKFLVLDAPTGCFVGDTKIRLLNGSTESIKNLVGKKDFFVISCDKNGDIVPGKVLDVWETKITDDLVKVTLDDGSSAICTSDHKFMLRNGEYKQAKDLSPDESLMPLYISTHNSTHRDYIYNPKDNKVVSLHTQIMKHNKPDEIKNLHLHHIDMDKQNNSPENLLWMESKDHASLHAVINYNDLSDSEKNNRTKGIIEYSRGVNKSNCQDTNKLPLAILRRDNANYANYTAKWKKANIPGYMEYISSCARFSSRRKYMTENEENCAKEYLNNLKLKFRGINQECYDRGMKTKEEWSNSLRNHSVVKVEKYIGDPVSVYDMEVETYHNFAIETSCNSGVIVHNSGKSHIAYQVGEVLNNYYDGLETLIITKTITLQDQYVSTFKDMKKLMGASNYSCNSKTFVPIPSNLKHHEHCKFTKSSKKCQYDKARKLYRNSTYKCLNYAFFSKGVNKYNTNGLLVIDEAHNFEETLIDLTTVSLNIESLDTEDLGYIKLSNYWDKHSNYFIRTLTYDDCICIYRFVCDKLTELFSISEEVELEISKIDNNYSEDDTEYSQDDAEEIKILSEKLKVVKRKLSSYSKIKFCLYYLQKSSDVETEWAIYKEVKPDGKEKSSLTIKPVQIPTGMIDFLFKSCSKVLFMSATALRITKSLGMEEDIKVVSVPYSFDLKNRPIYAFTSLPYFNKSSRNTVLPQYADAINEIVNSYDKNTNFLIHSVSYSNAEYLKKHLSQKSRVYIPTNLEMRKIKKHVKKGSITISPAMLEGIDMDDGLARVQIFLKVPYPYLGDVWVVKKKNNTPEWYNYKTVSDIIQGSGRGIRGENDKCDTIILDPSFKSVYNSVFNLVPSWWKNTISFL